MYAFGYVNSLESEVMSASPARLVEMLVRGALDSVGAARLYLRSGDIAARSRQITKAHAILTELATTLDHSADPAMAKQMVELYDYMLRRLIEANVRQAEEPLAEVEELLSPLAEAWARCAAEQERPAAMPFLAGVEAPLDYAPCECFG